MKKLKELFGNKNVQVMTGGLIKYLIVYALLQFLKPWIVTLIYISIVMFVTLCLIYADGDSEHSRSTVLFVLFTVCLPIGLVQMTLYCVAFHYLGIVGVPALSLAWMILYIFAMDDEDLPRTKTSSPDREEESSNEVHSLDGTAQAVPDHGVGSDPDGDSEIETRTESY